jgi:hypothetical protein
LNKNEIDDWQNTVARIIELVMLPETLPRLKYQDTSVLSFLSPIFCNPPEDQAPDSQPDQNEGTYDDDDPDEDVQYKSKDGGKNAKGFFDGV